MGRKLLIISASPVVRLSNGEGYSVFEPTLREVEHLAVLFDEIDWYGFPNGKVDSLLYRTPNSNTIKINAFPTAIGGQSFWEKLAIIPRLPLLILMIGVLFSRYRYIHTRGPSLPAGIAILYARIFRRKNIWHKYAGNWNHPHPPLSYRIQRNLLRRSVHPVTVNGLWNEPNPRILSFENPCFSEKELNQASEFSRPSNPECFKIVFVGRMETEKGVHIVLEAARNLTRKLQWFIVGEGKDESTMRKKVGDLDHVVFLGALNRHELNLIYQQCHFLLLPSLSEGFPKVISEACGFGCIPIVSNVSAISQYIKSDFGFLLSEISAKAVCEAIQDLTEGRKDLRQMSLEAVHFAKSFTYERFVKRIKEEVFKI